MPDCSMEQDPNTRLEATVTPILGTPMNVEAPDLGVSPPVGGGKGRREEERRNEERRDADDEEGGLSYTKGVGRAVSTQTPDYDFLSFSPRTCLELLPSLTPVQLEYETTYFRALLGPHFNCKPSTKRSPTAIANSLNSQIVVDHDKFISHFDAANTTNTHFSALLDRAERCLADMTVSAQPCNPHPKILEPEPVSFLNFHINSTVEDCSKDITFTRLGKREVAYFGHLPYAYGRAFHPARAYPTNNGFFGSIEQQIAQHDPGFSLREYSCLVSRYNDGGASIPPHADDEHCIAPGSNIYTVSVGAERTLHLTSRSVPLVERDYRLADGSIHVMTRSSQDHWLHSIPPDPTCKRPRVSFTFRKMDPNPTPPQPQTVPPIREDAPPARPVAPNKRVLFLTDSVNAGLDTSAFIGSGLTCIKDRHFYQLLDLDKYVDQFAGTDYVIISAGINDLSRYGQPASSICRFLSIRLRQWVRMFPNTTFIFNSILFTKFAWLNGRVRAVNETLFNLSLELRELYGAGRFYFLDTAHAVFRGISDFSRVLAPSGNGIHLTAEAARITHDCITQGVMTLDRPACTGAVAWPLRPEFRMAANLPRRCRIA